MPPPAGPSLRGLENIGVPAARRDEQIDQLLVDLFDSLRLDHFALFAADHANGDFGQIAGLLGREAAGALQASLLAAAVGLTVAVMRAPGDR